MAFLAVPEVAAAAEGAGAAEGGAGAAGAAGARGTRGRGKKGSRKGSSRNLNGLTPEEVREELQRRRDEAAKRGETLRGETQEEADRKRQPTPSATATASSTPVLGGRLEPMHTAGGFVLGLFGWVLFRNFLEGGMPQVKRWGAAKFLNKTGG